MFATLASAINVARPAVVAATPYVVRAAKVSAVIGAINFGTRLGLRSGANYLRRKANEEGLKKMQEEMRKNPEMKREDFDSYAAEMPGYRSTTLKEKFAFLWDVTWTSGMTTVSTFYASLTFPIYGTAWLLRYTGNVGLWLALRLGRVFGLAPWTEKSYNDRFQDKTRQAYWWVRTPTLGLSEKMNTPYVMGSLYEVQRAFFPHLFPDFYRWYEDIIKTQEDMKKGATPKDVFDDAVKDAKIVFDSEDVIRQQDAKADPGLRQLFISFESLKGAYNWNEEILKEDPETVARMVRQDLVNHNRKYVVQAESSLPKFLFYMHVPGYEAERFAAEFLQQGIRLKTEDSTASTGSPAV